MAAVSLPPSAATHTKDHGMVQVLDNLRQCTYLTRTSEEEKDEEKQSNAKMKVMEMEEVMELLRSLNYSYFWEGNYISQADTFGMILKK